MKRTSLALATMLVVAAPFAVLAQTAPAPAPKVTAPKATNTVAKPVTKPSVPRTTAVVKLPVTPKGLPPVRGYPKPAFTEFYQDIQIGTGKDAEPGKVYKVLYTGWRASDGVKFDSSADHLQPAMDKDGKPEKDADGKPKLAPQPLAFPQGRGRLIPGWDQGFAGMKVGGKRRLFIPWQLAYGNREIPAHGADHPGIPANSDLIFDVELVEVVDMPAPPPPGTPGARPGMQMMPQRTPPKPGTAPAPGAPAAAPLPTKPGTTPATPAPAAPATGAPAAPPAAAPSAAPAPAPSTPPAATTPPPAASTTPPHSK